VFNTVTERVIIGVLTALILGMIFAFWNVVRSIDVSIGVPSGAVLAFDQECPETGWRPYSEANGRFIVGAGAPTDPKHGSWQQVLPDGNLSRPIPLSSYQLRRSGGEETHIISELEMPSHDHKFTGAPIEFGGKGPDAYSRDKSPALGTADVSINFTPEGSISPTGSNIAHNNLPPYYPLNFCIKT
jgi:hypothetical protein